MLTSWCLWGYDFAEEGFCMGDRLDFRAYRMNKKPFSGSESEGDTWIRKVEVSAFRLWKMGGNCAKIWVEVVKTVANQRAKTNFLTNNLIFNF